MKARFSGVLFVVGSDGDQTGCLTENHASWLLTLWLTAASSDPVGSHAAFQTAVWRHAGLPFREIGVPADPRLQFVHQLTADLPCRAPAPLRIAFAGSKAPE
jgi:hypothetical protein